MMKRLMILALAVLAVPVYADNQTREAHQRENSRSPSWQTADASIQQNSSPPLKNEPQHHIDADVKVVSLPAKDWEDKATFFVNLALAIAGFLAIGVGICTLRTVKRQTDLQEIAYTQSIKIENWEVAAQQIAPSDQTPSREMLIGFDIVNGSEFPLTMKSATISSAGYRVFESTNDAFLPPHTPYRIRLVVQITSAEFDVWEKAIISISLQGKFESVGVLKSLICQTFRGLLITEKRKTPYFQYEISMVPEDKPGAHQKTK